MTEKHFVIEDIEPVLFYGTNNGNIRLLRALFPKLRLVARDNVVKTMGEDGDIKKFAEVFESLQSHGARYNRLTEEDVVNIVRSGKTGGEDSSEAIAANLYVLGQRISAG